MPTQRRQIMGAVKSEYWDELMKRLDEEDGYVPDEEEELVVKVTTTTEEKRNED